MSIRDAYLPILDGYRGMLATVWDLRRYDVSVQVTTWAPGTLPGAHGGTQTPTVTPLLAGGARPKVERISQRDVIASGGRYADQDLRVGPLTPKSDAYPSGIDPATFDPPIGATSTEVLFGVSGPGIPTGAWFRKVGQEVTANFHFYLILRSTGAQDG